MGRPTRTLSILLTTPWLSGATTHHQIGKITLARYRKIKQYPDMMTQTYKTVAGCAIVSHCGAYFMLAMRCEAWREDFGHRYSSISPSTSAGMQLKWDRPCAGFDVQ